MICMFGTFKAFLNSIVLQFSNKQKVIIKERVERERGNVREDTVIGILSLTAQKM